MEQKTGLPLWSRADVFLSWSVMDQTEAFHKEEARDNLRIKAFPTRADMGRKAAEDVARRIDGLLKTKATLRMIFAAAPSQVEMLEALKSDRRIAWDRIVAFHMDEYIGLNGNDPRSFSYFLSDRLFNHVRLREVNLMRGDAPPREEIRRYTDRLREAPIDIVCLGIGENGHIAFNDPHVADFNDPLPMKRVRLDEACRTQQVNDRCFHTLAEVPREALTLTIPTLLHARHLFCVVPGSRKQRAVQDALYGPVDPACPASVLRTHPDCTFYFDRDAYGS
ncbi:MAG: glucosamine-6-phosphate deaminase [Bacteroidales bacterium]